MERTEGVSEWGTQRTPEFTPNPQVGSCVDKKAQGSTSLPKVWETKGRVDVEGKE